MVAKYRIQVEDRNGRLSELRKSELVAEKILARYAKLSGGVGATSGLAAFVPGVGTAIGAIGGATADAAACMKLQVDMCICLAAAFGYDVADEDARHLSFLIAATGSLEKAGVQWGSQVASKAGVRLLRQYLRGAVLQAIKEFFKKLGIVFTRKAIEKALPFGIGVVIGGTANYALTKYVGAQAVKWFVIDAELPDE